MVHRYIMRTRGVLGPDYTPITGNTTVFLSGNTEVTNGEIFNRNVFDKTITIPLQLNFNPMDYSDEIDKWVEDETKRSVNKMLDGERVKYLSNNKEGITINFRFLNKRKRYTSLYSDNGFIIPDEYKLNRFKKSYFRLYFYDSDNSEKSNLLFVEDFPVTQNEEATFILKSLFWDKDDDLMVNSLNNRVVYVEAKFFNAKNGKVQSFFNLPVDKISAVSITEYSDLNNKNWRYSPIEMINPNNNNQEYRFKPLMAGGTTQTSITFSEFILL